MARARLLVAAALLALTVGAAGALAYWSATREPAASGAFAVTIVGPGNATLWSGRVDVENATALSALQAAGKVASLEVKTRDYPGLGTYVWSIGGHEARRADGWIYEVDRGQGWVAGDRSADQVALRAGDALRWRWTDA